MERRENKIKKKMVRMCFLKEGENRRENGSDFVKKVFSPNWGENVLKMGNY